MATDLKPVYCVPVRVLIEFALRRGPLGSERRFAGPERAQAGIRAQHQLQRARPAGYQKEVAVCHEVEADTFLLRIQGRIDGVQTTPMGVVVEEIKTVQGAWDRRPDPLHWAQAKFYGFFYAREHALDTLHLQLTYLDLDTGKVTEFAETHTAAALAAFCEGAISLYLAWMREWQAWRQQRDNSIRALTFPFPRYRPGQRKMAVAAYRALARGRRLFLEAPTGIGKTMAVVFPALKVLSEGRLEQVFYLTARTVGRTVAESALATLRQGGLRLRALTLTAREKICIRENQPCDPWTCPRAQGYYDRRHAALRAALECEAITRSVVEAVGREHQVCPFELALDLCPWVDVLIGDYNY